MDEPREREPREQILKLNEPRERRATPGTVQNGPPKNRRPSGGISDQNIIGCVWPAAGGKNCTLGIRKHDFYLKKRLRMNYSEIPNFLYFSQEPREREPREQILKSSEPRER